MLMKLKETMYSAVIYPQLKLFCYRWVSEELIFTIRYKFDKNDDIENSFSII